MQTVKGHAAELVVISDDAETLVMGRIALGLPAGAPEWLSPLTAIIPGQLFAMHLAHTRDLDPDRPRSLQKVTETL
jgi:glucosamine--fructose-6-phosphate aminotransferase (isomerizing)